MFEYKQRLLELLKSPKKSIYDIEYLVNKYFFRLLDRSRKAGLWMKLSDIKNFSQEEGLAFEKAVNDILEKQYE